LSMNMFLWMMPMPPSWVVSPLRRGIDMAIVPGRCWT
jgi:hypothetical protein